MVQFGHLDLLKLLQAQQIQICLWKAGELVTRGQIFEVGGGVARAGEENLVVDENLLFTGFIWVQRHKLVIHNSFGSFICCLDKVGVDFVDGAIFLHTLHEGFCGEILHNLELFVPFAHILGVKPVKGSHTLGHLLCVGHLHPFGLLLEPIGVAGTDWVQKVGLRFEDRSKVCGQILRKERTHLIQAAGKSVREARSGSCWRFKAELASLRRVVPEEAVGAACNNYLLGGVFEGFHGQVEKIAGEFPLSRHRVEARILNALHALDVLQMV